METTISCLLKIIQKDKAIGPYPASLYTAMLTCWQEQGCRESFRVSRSILDAAFGHPLLCHLS